MAKNDERSSLSAAARDVTRVPRDLDNRIWKSEDKMRPEIRSALVKIAEDVWEGTETAGADLLDVTLTGSTTGRRWSPIGDLDVHLVIKLSDVDADEELATSYFRLRGKMWNSQHKVEIAGHPVEVYIQNVDEPHYSAGVYSLLRDEWVQKQDPGEWAPYRDVAKKAKVIARDINELIGDLKKPAESKLEASSNMTEKLRKMRQVGLESEGEGSVENLAYKALRRAGYLDKLSAATREAFDELFSS